MSKLLIPFLIALLVGNTASSNEAAYSEAELYALDAPFATLVGGCTHECRPCDGDKHDIVESVNVDAITIHLETW